MTLDSLKCQQYLQQKNKLFFGLSLDGSGRMQELEQCSNCSEVTLKTSTTKQVRTSGQKSYRNEFILEQVGRVAHLMSQEKCLELSFGPVVHGVRQQLHGERVHSQKVPNKHNSLNFLLKKVIKIIRVLGLAYNQKR